MQAFNIYNNLYTFIGFYTFFRFSLKYFIKKTQEVIYIIYSDFFHLFGVTDLIGFI